MERTIIGRLPFFSITFGDFNSFIERLEQFFLLNKIDYNEKQRVVLLIAVDEQSYKVFCDLVYPNLPKDKTYQELVDAVRQHVSQRTLTWKYRIEFNNAKQEENESIGEWIERVRRFAIDCKVTYENDLLLINRFIVGMWDKNVQQRLFEKNYEQLTINIYHYKGKWS